MHCACMTFTCIQYYILGQSHTTRAESTWPEVGIVMLNNIIILIMGLAKCILKPVFPYTHNLINTSRSEAYIAIDVEIL